MGQWKHLKRFIENAMMRLIWKLYIFFFRRVDFFKWLKMVIFFFLLLFRFVSFNESLYQLWLQGLFKLVEIFLVFVFIILESKWTWRVDSSHSKSTKAWTHLYRFYWAAAIFTVFELNCRRCGVMKALDWSRFDS